jgi:hypothetical protein
MTYYPENYDDHAGKALPECLIDEGIGQDGTLAFQERMFLITEMLADVRFLMQGKVPAPIRKRIIDLWCINDDDRSELREEVDAFIGVWDALEAMVNEEKE